MLDDPSSFPKPKHSIQVTAQQAGFVHTLDALEIGLSGVGLGAGREAAEDQIDFSAGVCVCL